MNEKDVKKDNKEKDKNMQPESVVPEKKAKEPIKEKHITRYPEIEEKIAKAIEANDSETIMLLNELTLARNLESELSTKETKQFNVATSTFRVDGVTVKRAGVYNSMQIKHSGEVEDILVEDNFYSDDRILVVSRDSSFLDHFDLGR